MNEQALCHIPESKYCFAVDSHTVKLRLRLDKNDIPDSVQVVYGGKYEFATIQHTAEMLRCYVDRLYAYYETALKLDDLRLTYVFRICNKGKIQYFSEDGLTDSYDFELNYFNCFQYAFINECDVHSPIDWMKNAVFYQIFVERFRIGNTSKDMSYVNLHWGDLPNSKSFAGGDLKGIEEKLDYIKSLGVNALYLTPIFTSHSNHKYDIIDYFKVDPHFGTNDDLICLIEAAHSKGIKVVLDAVFNHCSEDSYEFQDVRKNGKKSLYYDWFIIKNDEPFSYECFASCDYMPKFNTSNLEVQEYLIDIALHWLKYYNVDGWRLDVSDEVSHEFWRKFRMAIKDIDKDCVLIGENWHDANVYLQGDQFDSIMNYAFTKACLDFYAFDNFDVYQFADKLNEILMRNTDAVNIMMLNLLDSHDTHRFLTRAKSEDKLLSAIALLFFFVGTPCIYYGTENAMQGNYDPDSRRTFDWEMEDKQTAEKSLIRFLAKIKSSGELNGADTKIYAKDGLLHIERNGLRLTINGEQSRPYAAVALYYNGFDGRNLAANGFVIEIIVKEETK